MQAAGSLRSKMQNTGAWQLLFLLIMGTPCQVGARVGMQSSLR